MKVKILEIRDRLTFIPVMAIQMEAANPIEGYYFGRTGFGSPDQVILMRLSDQKAYADPYDWGASARTMPTAHLWIEQNFAALRDGDVVDVRVILGEELQPAVSERLTEPIGE